MNEGSQDYGIGVSVLRTEDRRLVTGSGSYADDVSIEGQVYAYMLRSPHAHGVIQSIDGSEALNQPGVLSVITGQEMKDNGVGPLTCKLPHKSKDGTPLIVPYRPAVAIDRVRFAGEIVAVVVAETLAQARDAAELVEVEIDPLPVTADVEDAIVSSVQLHDEAPKNVVLDWQAGASSELEEAFSQAAHVSEMLIRTSQVAATPIEPRAGVANYDSGSGKFTFHAGAQGAFGLSRTLAETMGVDGEKVRVLIEDVGGSFGMKGAAYPEYIAALYAARQLGKPVKWCADRSESFLSDQPGRDILVKGAIALDADGVLLAVRLEGISNMGAYLTGVATLPSTANVRKNTPSCYRLPHLEVSMRCVLTNTPPVGPYRGAGRPDGNYFMERLLDRAARDGGFDPVELRSKNLISADEMPYTATSEQVYDSGEFATGLAVCLDQADWNGFEGRKTASEKKGLVRGRGISCYLEATAPPGKEMGGIRFEVDGTVTIVTGTLSYGQGHQTAFPQILNDRLGIPYEKINLLQGDSDALIAGGGTGGSRSVMASGTAIHEAAKVVLEKARQAASYFLEASEADLEFRDGAFSVAGTDRSITLLDLAEELRAASLPSEAPTDLDASLVVDTPPSAFPNGCHICEVEIDPETGTLEVDRYFAVNDFGTLINPMLVEGQVHGGVVQGLGQIVMEQSIYDEDGQNLTGSLMDYALPRADDVPYLEVGFHSAPATTNVLGAKGCGEAGTTGAMPAVMNAVMDALSQRGVKEFEMPATPLRVWSALKAA